jgi:flagellar basal body-associated protein FliL
LIYKKVKRKRSKALTIMLLPALIFMAVVGWFMYSVDNKNSTNIRQKRRKTAKEGKVTLMPIDFEEQRLIRINNAMRNR